MLILNMSADFEYDNSFSNYSRKMFSPTFENVLHEFLHSDKFENADFKNMKIAFQNCNSKIPN